MLAGTVTSLYRLSNRCRDVTLQASTCMTKQELVVSGSASTCMTKQEGHWFDSAGVRLRRSSTHIHRNAKPPETVEPLTANFGFVMQVLAMACKCEPLIFPWG